MRFLRKRNPWRLSVSPSSPVECLAVSAKGTFLGLSLGFSGSGFSAYEKKPFIYAVWLLVFVRGRDLSQLEPHGCSRLTLRQLLVLVLLLSLVLVHSIIIIITITIILLPAAR